MHPSLPLFIEITLLSPLFMPPLPGSKLKAFDIDNKAGGQALERVLRDILGDTQHMPGVEVGQP